MRDKTIEVAWIYGGRKNFRIGLKSYMPSAAAEGQTAAMGTAARPWRLNTASRLQRSPVYAGQSIIHAVVLYMPLLAA